MSGRARPFIALATSLILAASIVFGVLGYILPQHDVPRLAREPAVVPALSRRLLFVVVDGLRYDVATDAARMPRFSRAMREQASGELWAGRVSMTTSAILTIATGQRATFEQIVFNAFPRPPPYDSWLAEAKHADKRVFCAGDPAWTQMFGAYVDEKRLDPEGVAIDVDFNPETFAHARELRDKSPDLLIVHFTTPDHQAHAYTVPSARYAAHITGFDRDLFEFLDELGPDWTVLVVGDHGASDSGTHGTDVAIQRRTVVWGRGPGIQRGVHTPARIDQADLAATISALLGVPAPVHSRGHVLVDWLDVSPDLRIRIACANARRALELARTSSDTACDSVSTATALVTHVDAELENQTGTGGVVPRALSALFVMLGLLAAAIALRPLATRSIAKASLGAIGLGALGIALTWGVERFSGGTPLRVRILFFVLGNLPALALLVVPRRAGRFAERFPLLAALMVPGFLIATYTTNVQPEAYLAIVLGGALITFRGGLDRDARRVLAWPQLAVIAVAMLLLFFPGTRTVELYPSWLRRNASVAFAVALGSIALAPIVLSAFSSERRRWSIALGGAVFAAGALAARRIAGPIEGRLAIVIGLATAIGFALRKQRLLALSAGLFTYAWISRDLELVPLVAAVLVADGVGAALGRHLENERPFELPSLLLVTAFVFGIAFVERVGIQTALDFGSMDWGAAGFGDRHAPAVIVGVALGLKYVVALGLALGAFVSRLPADAARSVLRAAFVAFVARSVVLAVMFLLAGESFWTGLRVLGEIPFALLWTVTAGAIWVAQPFSMRSSSS